MSDTSVHPAAETLLNGPVSAENPTESTIARVAKESGVHPLRQMKDIFLMRFGAQKLGANEYYDLRVFDPVHDRKAKRAFLGQGGINALNMAINPDTLMEAKNFVGNKLTYTHHLAEKGIATTQTQAFVTADIALDQGFVLNDSAAIESFMRDTAVYPLFGKPLGGSLSVGSVRIEKIDGDNLHLGKGGRVSVAEFCADVLRYYPDGYLLQTALVPHRDLSRVAGDAIGSMRIVTTHDGTAARPTYAVWKLPAPNAMSDNFWQDGSMLALVDLASGTVLNCHRGKGPGAELLQDHPVSGQPVVGLQVPFWDDVLKAACDAHDLTPDLGICGFDVAITDQGPVILECNDKPNHMLYQYPARKGVRQPDLAPIWKSLVSRKRAAA